MERKTPYYVAVFLILLAAAGITVTVLNHGEEPSTQDVSVQTNSESVADNSLQVQGQGGNNGNSQGVEDAAQLGRQPGGQLGQEIREQLNEPPTLRLDPSNEIPHMNSIKTEDNLAESNDQELDQESSDSPQDEDQKIDPFKLEIPNLKLGTSISPSQREEREEAETNVLYKRQEDETGEVESD